MTQVVFRIENRAIPIVEAVLARGEAFRDRLMADWQPFKAAGLSMCSIEREGGRLIAVPSAEYIRFCRERGVDV